MARISTGARTQVRRRLLDAAARQFAVKGLDATNIDDVATGAGFGKGTVYNYFHSKEDLFAEVVTEGCRRAAERWAAAPQVGSLRRRLESLAAVDVAEMRDDEGFTKVLVREAMSFRPETYPLIVEHLEPYLDAVAGVLQWGRDRGQIRGDIAISELALGFVGMLSLLYIQHWGTNGAWPDLDDIPELAVTLFLDGGAHGMPRRRKQAAR